MKKPLVSLTLFSFLLFAPTLALSAPEKVKEVPTDITSRSMVYDANGQTVVFSGEVHVKRQDFKLWADKLTVYLDKKNAPTASDASDTSSMNAGKLDRIVAENNVRMESDENSGTCQKATYFAKTDKFVMEGKPVLKGKNKSTVTGNRIVHYIKQNRTEVPDKASVSFMAPDKTLDNSSLSKDFKN